MKRRSICICKDNGTLFVCPGCDRDVNEIETSLCIIKVLQNIRSSYMDYQVVRIIKEMATEKKTLANRFKRRYSDESIDVERKYCF